MDRELIRNVRLLSICRFMLYAQLVDENGPKYSVKHYLHSLQIAQFKARNRDVYMYFLICQFATIILYLVTILDIIDFQYVAN